MAVPILSESSRSSWATSLYIAEALHLELERDESVLMLGEDVGKSGGVFGTSRKLQEVYGEGRVRDTPIAEMGFAGMGVGLAMSGFRPVIELMFADFIGVCLEQVYNAAAKIPFMSGGRVKVPMVLKTAGGLIGSAAQHSQTLWGLFAHLPGLQVVAPSRPYDYKGLLAAAVESDTPTVYIEHKSLLLTKLSAFHTAEPVPEERYIVPIGKARVARAGSDLTLVTLSENVEHALHAADDVSDDADVEVIDLRSVVPLDMDAVCESVARTGRLLVVDEDYLSFGLSGEVVARVAERLGPASLRQVVRHAIPDVPIPAALSLEQAVVPGRASIAAAIRKMADAS